MRVRIEFEVEIPTIAGVLMNDEQVEEWLRYELNDNGQMMRSNPLDGSEVEPVFGTFQWEWKT